MTTYVDAEGVVVAGTPADFAVTVRQDGSAVDLTGKTVTATVRATGDPGTAIDETLEGAAVNVTTPESGLVTFVLTAEMSTRLATPADPRQTRQYYLQLVVTDDDYAPQLVRFHARRAGAALS